MSTSTELLKEIIDYLDAKSLNGFDVNIQDQVSPEVNLYLHVNNLETNPAETTTLDSYTIVLDSVLGIAAGDVITIYEGSQIYQSVITDITDTTVTMASSLDSVFTTAAEVCAGDWKLNLDGSVTDIIASVKAPPLSSFDIYSVNITMTDGAAMDSAKFGGITALSNGVVLRHKDGILKNLLIAVNNVGFSEQGFTLQYDPKAPSGVYGIQIKKNYHEVSGIAIRVNGATSDELQLIIRDDLTDLSLLTVTVQGHVVI